MTPPVNVPINAAPFRPRYSKNGYKTPIPPIIAPEDARKQARDYSSQIFKDWHLLKAILDRHEPTIHKRWSKQSKKKRCETLLKLWPNMSATHRPDYQAYMREENDQQRQKGTKFHEAYMWPFINLEDLTKPKTLPLFLQARARNAPDVFAFSDYDATSLGHLVGTLRPVAVPYHTMALTNCTTPETYGELVDWSETPIAKEWAQTGRGLYPGLGLLVLEMQQRIYRFLVESCQSIMHDISTDDLTSIAYPVQPPVALAKEAVDGFDSNVVMAEEAPYRSPAQMDLVRLEALLAAKMSSAEDHIWALREDPGYFAETLLEYKEHQMEMLKDMKGRPHPFFTTGREDLFWKKVLLAVIQNANLMLEVWSELHARVKELRTLEFKYRGVISPDQVLPYEYLVALLLFQRFLNEAMKGPRSLSAGYAASPPWRPYFASIGPRDSTSKVLECKMIGMPCSNWHVGPQADLCALIDLVSSDDGRLHLIGLPIAIDELERLIQSEPKAKEMVSSFLSEVFFDISVLGQATRQLQLYQPYQQTFELLLEPIREEIEKLFEMKSRGWRHVTIALQGPTAKRIAQLGEPDKGKFFYPVDKRRSKQNVEAMRSAEKNLDAFWSAVDKDMQTILGGWRNKTYLWKLLSKSRVLQRTPEWIEPDKQARKDDKVDVSVITKPLSELYFDLQFRTERTLDRSSQISKPTATKTKTKGVPTASTPAGETQPENHPDIQPIFPLDPRALKTFRTLFYTPSLNATPGEVPWTDFLHAMVATGFKPEKLYGSVWQFSPSKLDVERSIQFHEPHPSGKLPYTTARRFGRRLNRAYGWRGDMFVPKLKEVVIIDGN